MPKNTYFIKENYKKVEEVREIDNKYEIPTYEEFLNNYNQDQVNYSDLTNIDISSSKGYGPCAWRNNQYGERFTSLRIPCPADGCGNTSIANLTHTGGCGGNLEISNRARVKCLRCGTVNHVSSWNLACSNHSGYYGQTNINSLQRALSVALSNGSMDSDIVMELIQHLRSSW